MSQDPPSADRPSLASRVRDTLIRSRRAAADVAATEEAVAEEAAVAVAVDVAATYEQAAQRSGPQAGHLQQLAAQARDCAEAARRVVERERLAAGDQDDLTDI
jgi:hypothetical protein